MKNERFNLIRKRMAELNKEFEYKKHNFNISVKLNYKVERGLNGKREHEVIINCMDKSNFYQKALCQSNQLEDCINEMITHAKQDVDKKEFDCLSLDEQLLVSLGFK